MLPDDDTHEELAHVLGKGVRKYRKKRGMKQDELGRSLGYADRSNISKIEQGKALPSLDKAFVLARVLQVACVEDLLKETPGDETLLRPLTLMAMQWDIGCRDDFVAFLRQLADLLEMIRKPSSPPLTP